MWVVDTQWSGRAIDVEVGDLILAQRRDQTTKGAAWKALKFLGIACCFVPANQG